MRDRAAQDGGMQHPLAREVGNIFAAPAQEAQILDAFDRGSNVSIDSGHDLSVLRYAARFGGLTALNQVNFKAPKTNGLVLDVVAPRRDERASRDRGEVTHECGSIPQRQVH
jgi:hypothetical protein